MITKKLLQIKVKTIILSILEKIFISEVGIKQKIKKSSDNKFSYLDPKMTNYLATAGSEDFNSYTNRNNSPKYRINYEKQLNTPKTARSWLSYSNFSFSANIKKLKIIRKATQSMTTRPETRVCSTTRSTNNSEFGILAKSIKEKINTPAMQDLKIEFLLNKNKQLEMEEE